MVVFGLQYVWGNKVQIMDMLHCARSLACSKDLGKGAAVINVLQG